MDDDLRWGLIAGGSAAAVVAIALFVDEGPGANLATLARWFGLGTVGGAGASKWLGALLLLALGALLGGLFGAVLRGRQVTFTHAILLGLGAGMVLWVVTVALLGMVIHRAVPSPYTQLLLPALSLLYGLLLGSLYVSHRVRGTP